MGDESRWHDWAQNALGKIKKQRDDKRLSDKVFLAENDLKKQDVPQVWAQIRANMKSMCDALNAEADTALLSWDSARTNQAIIKVSASGVNASALFNPETLTVVLDGPDGEEIYTPTVINNNVLFASGSTPRQAHEIAKRFLDSIVAQLR